MNTTARPLRPPWVIGGDPEPAQPSTTEVPSLTALLNQLGPLPPLTACAGLNRDGQPLLLRLNTGRLGHALIMGGANSGKTALLENLVASLAISTRQSHLQLVLIATHGHAFEGAFCTLPHLLRPEIVARKRYEIETALDWVNLARVSRRVAQETGPDTKVADPAIVVAIDDLDQVSVHDKVLAETLKTIPLGAPVGIHLLVTSSIRLRFQVSLTLSSTARDVPGEFAAAIKGKPIPSQPFHVCALPADWWRPAAQRPARVSAGHQRQPRVQPEAEADGPAERRVPPPVRLLRGPRGERR